MSKCIFLLFILSNSIYATALFKCELPISLFNSGFEQGQELFMDVLLEDNEPEVMLFSGSGPKAHVNKNLAVEYVGFSADRSTFVISWGAEGSYLSMVYLGNKTWGAYLRYENPENSFPKESELICKELEGASSFPELLELKVVL